MVIPVRHYELPEWYTPERRAKRIARMKARCVITEAGCWEYQAHRNTFGYIQVVVGQDRWMAHRLMYALMKGDLPPKLYVCHTCDNRCCINPDHMFLGDHLANQQDKHRKGRCPQKAKTHCPHGHPYTEENTYVCTRGFRACRECQRIRNKRNWIERPEYMKTRQRSYRRRRREQTIFD